MPPSSLSLHTFATALTRPTRRQLLRWSALSGLALAVLGGKARASPARGADEPEDGPLALEPAHHQILEAATWRILPSDQAPGAREANVIRFLDRQLAGELRAIRPAFSTCAALLDQWAQRQYAGKGYIDLDIDAQDRVLRDLSLGAIPAPGFPQREAFRALHTLTLEGYLSDPAHGGNVDMIGWRTLGIPAPHRRSAAEARAEDPAAPARKHKLRIVE